MKDVIETLLLTTSRWSDKDKEYARSLLRAIAVGLIEHERRESEETDMMEDEYSNHRNNEICEQRLKGGANIC